MDAQVQKVVLLHADVQKLASLLASYIKQWRNISLIDHIPKVYGVPRGGTQAAYLVALYCDIVIVDTPIEADIFIDDIIDSGITMEQFCDKYPQKPFFALIDKTDASCKYLGKWVEFPWEKNDSSGIENNVRRILQFVGEDANREGLQETPARVAKAWKQWTSGYNVDIPALLKVFEDGADGYDEMVMVKDIPIYSKCEHHLADIFGTCTIAYIPNGKIVGLSKLSRVADAFARRLQVQERLTSQIANALNDNLNPQGVGVIIRARHMCMEARGICQQGHHTVTSALRGVFKTDPTARAEFLALARS